MSIEPGRLVRRQVGGRRRLAIIDLKIVVRSTIGFADRRTNIETHIRIGRLQRNRYWRHRRAQRQGPDVDIRAALHTTEEDEIRRFRQWACNLWTLTAAQQVDFEEVRRAKKNLLAFFLVSVGAIEARALVRRGEEFNRSNQRLIAYRANLNATILDRNEHCCRQTQWGFFDHGNACVRQVGLIAIKNRNIRRNLAHRRDLDALEGDVWRNNRPVARWKLLLNLVAENRNQAMMNIGP
jgi:hypothetical protein